MDPHITDWVTKPAQIPKEYEMGAYQFECDATASSACVVRIVRGFSRTFKLGKVILKLHRPVNVAFPASDLEPVAFFPALCYFDLQHCS